MDKKTNPKPDVKVIQRPGGNSSFKLGWDDVPAKPKQVKKQVLEEEEDEEEKKKKELLKKEGQETTDGYQKLKDVKTSVKTRAPPGGKSNLTLG